MISKEILKVAHFLQNKRKFSAPRGGIQRPPSKFSLAESAAPEFLQAILGNHLRDKNDHYHQKLSRKKFVR